MPNCQSMVRPPILSPPPTKKGFLATQAILHNFHFWIFFSPNFFTSIFFLSLSLFYAFLHVLCHPECSFSPQTVLQWAVGEARHNTMLPSISSFGAAQDFWSLRCKEWLMLSCFVWLSVCLSKSVHHRKSNERRKNKHLYTLRFIHLYSTPYSCTGFQRCLTYINGTSKIQQQHLQSQLHLTLDQFRIQNWTLS